MCIRDSSYLIDAFNTIFDRIFNSNDVFIRIVDIGERRVQSCRFAAAGRTCDKYDAIGRVEQTAIQLSLIHILFSRFEHVYNILLQREKDEFKIESTLASIGLYQSNIAKIEAK